MIVNFQQIAPIIAACMTTGGLIFQIGKHAEKLDVIGVKVDNLVELHLIHLEQRKLFVKNLNVSRLDS